MFGWCANVKIIKNEGTIIFGNIKQYAPSTNEVTIEPAGSEQTSENTEAGVSERMNRKARGGKSRACRKKHRKKRVLPKNGKPFTHWTSG
jgi:hypothetical protein